uniref:Putative secreted protein n=1 Tax=Ixodes ricinus TaxID=34613 RepID=A0A090XE97_IXORI
MQHLLWIALLVAAAPTWAAGDCDIETIREKVAATDERLRRTDNSGPRGGYSFSKQTCEELEILFNAIESRLSRCTESEKNRYGLILDSGRRMAELKRSRRHGQRCLEGVHLLPAQLQPHGRPLHGAAERPQGRVQGVFGRTDQQQRRLLCLPFVPQVPGRQAVRGLRRRGVASTRNSTRTSSPTRLLYNFCKNYETSVCVDTDSGSQLTMSVFTLFVAYLCCPDCKSYMVENNDRSCEVLSRIQI